MKILILADVESKGLYDYFEKSKLDGIDLIISCGDLKASYLSFLATFTKAPVLYIHGNHDNRYETDPPEGCIDIDDKIYCFRGLRILGLGGCLRYKPGPYMYTQKEMHKRAKKLRWKLHRSHGFDILVGHAPAYRINDGTDMPHTGFEVFVKLMDRYAPRYFLHGHVHANYSDGFKRRSAYGKTEIINGYERYILEIDDDTLRNDTSRKARMDRSGMGYFL